MFPRFVGKKAEHIALLLQHPLSREYTYIFFILARKVLYDEQKLSGSELVTTPLSRSAQAEEKLEELCDAIFDSLDQ